MIEIKYVISRGPWTGGRLVWNLFQGLVDNTEFPPFFRELFLDHATVVLPKYTTEGVISSDKLYKWAGEVVDYFRKEDPEYVVKYAKIVATIDGLEIISSHEHGLYILHLDDCIVTEEEAYDIYEEFFVDEDTPPLLIDTSSFSGKEATFLKAKEAEGEKIVVVPYRRNYVTQITTLIRPIAQYLMEEGILDVASHNPVRKIHGTLLKNLNSLRSPRGMEESEEEKGDVMYG